MKLVISVPERLGEVPLYWPPIMPVDLASLQSEGEDIEILDNFIFRYPLDVVKKEFDRLKKPSELFLWATARSYPNLKDYLKTFPEAQILGFPNDWLEKLSVKDVRLRPMPVPSLYLLPLNVYWANCKVAFTPETLEVQKFAVVDFHYDGHLVNVRHAAQILHFLRLKYCPEFFVIDTDLTSDRHWTLSLLKRLEDLELTGLFRFSCRGHADRVDWHLLKLLREAGCHVMDFGKLDVTELASHSYQVRLPAAIEACRMTEIAPVLTPTIGMPNTSIIDIIEATKLLRSYSLLSLPQPIGVERFSQLAKDAEDKEKLLLQLANQQANLTGWNDAMFYGLIKLMDMGDVEKLGTIS